MKTLAHLTCIGWIVCLILWFVGTLSIWPFVCLFLATGALSGLSWMTTTTPEQQIASDFLNSLSQNSRSGRSVIDARPEQNPVTGDSTNE